MWVVFAAACLLAGFLLIRRMMLGDRHTVFDCVLRAPDLKRPRWRPGLARYQGDHIQWFPVWSFGVGPALDLRRSQIIDLTVSADAAEALPSPMMRDDMRHVLVKAHLDGRAIEFEMLLGKASSLGLMSWVEAGPRGLMRR